MILLCVFVLSLFSTSFAVAQSVDLLPPPTEVTVAGSPIVLRWKDNSLNEGRFVVERRPALRLSWEPIAHVDWNETSYTDRRTDAGRYCYRVYAENATGPSQPSNEACLNFAPPPTLLPVLTYANCCVTTAEPKGVAVITWPPPPPGIGMHLERRLRDDTAKWVRVSGPVAAEGLWHEHGINLTSPYCWRAVFVEKTKDTALSNRVCSND